MVQIKKLKPSSFPRLLKEIPDPPKQLYLRGRLPNEENYVFLAVVGSRKISSYGKQVCESLISELSGQPICIVSGLALGIDGLAHRAALKAGLPTVAIPGSGLSDKVLYPASHRGLAQEILRAGGTLISEFEPDFKATLYSFPQRNRIMAGISHATLVIEANERSGTLITARLALEYNRDVLTVPGSIFNPQSKGPHQLLRLGATPITSGIDILNHFNLASEKSFNINLDDLSQDEQNIIKCLLEEPLPKDTLIEKIGISITKANVLLSGLELKELVEEKLGKYTIK